MAAYYKKFSTKIVFMQDDNLKNKKKVLVSTMGNIIKKLRLSKSKSIYKISAECSMSKATWREVELGLCNDISLSTLYKIADGLEIPLYKLFFELNKVLGEKFSITD